MISHFLRQTLIGTGMVFGILDHTFGCVGESKLEGSHQTINVNTILKMMTDGQQTKGMAALYSELNILNPDG